MGATVSKQAATVNKAATVNMAATRGPIAPTVNMAKTPTVNIANAPAVLQPKAKVQTQIPSNDSNEQVLNSATVSRLKSAQIITKSVPLPSKTRSVSEGTLEIDQIEALLDSDPRLKHFSKIEQ